MWKYISRKTQYALWIFPALFLLLNPFWNISSKWSIENILFIYEPRTLQEAEGYFSDVWNQSDDFVENSDNYVYRALNQKDYERYTNGLGLEAKNPNGSWYHW